MIDEGSPALEVAALSRRAIAFMIDAGLTLALSLTAANRIGSPDLLAHGDGFIVWWIVLGASYVTLLSGNGRGQTLGKRLTGVRIAREDGQPIGYTRAFLRWLATGACWAFGLWVGGIVDLVTALFNRRRRTLHDLLADTVVVRATA